jgi:transcriptional/translational regulatory protein YebC/TACO1
MHQKLPLTRLILLCSYTCVLLVPQRAIKRAVEGSQGDFKENVYEAYGHGGVGIIITALTDNVNRANADIKTICNKKDLKMASSGSVAFQVDTC